MSANDPKWTVYPAPISAVLQTAEHFGADTQQLMRQADLSMQELQNSESRIPVAKLHQLYDLAATATNNPDFALAVGRIIFLRGLNLQLYMTTICHTCREYLKLMPSVLLLRGDIGEVIIKPEGELLALIWQPLQADTAAKRHLSDEALAASAMIINSLCISPVAVKKANFTYTKPNQINRLQELFGNNLNFDQDVTCLYFERSSLSFPLVKSDYDSYSSGASSFHSTFDQPQSADSFLDSMTKAIVHLMPTGTVGIDAVAGRLNVSRRTLQRRLSDRDTNFQQVLQKVRGDMAVRYLADKRLAVTEIAFLLGYADQASFSAAFKSWYGKSPSDYRH
jgi:AraC-like DNA-binding protein